MNFIYNSPEQSNIRNIRKCENSKENLINGKYNNEIQKERDEKIENEISEFNLDNIEEEYSSNTKLNNINKENPKSKNLQNIITNIII